MLETLYKLGIIPSRSRPRVSDDNPYSESLFKTCKYTPNYPRDGFKTIEKARAWVKDFVHWYKHEHRHSGIKFLTPHQRHTKQGEAIMERRQKVYECARRKHPERWTGDTRDWSLQDEVWLNPVNASERKKEETENKATG